MESATFNDTCKNHEAQEALSTDNSILKNFLFENAKSVNSLSEGIR